MSEPVTAAAHAAGGTDPMRPERYRVVRTWPETHDTFTMVLAPVEAGTRYRFAPGQFNMLYLPGVGEAAISMSGDPDDTRQVVHTVRAVGRVTKLLQGLKRGDEVGLRGPFGTPWPVDLARGRDVLLVAGGIGLAPLRPVVHHLLRHREQFGHVCLLSAPARRRTCSSRRTSRPGGAASTSASRSRWTAPAPNGTAASAS
jgi:2-polyprenylphenol hydroxylase and related flavodoxin oxidoreductases